MVVVVLGLVVVVVVVVVVDHVWAWGDGGFADGLSSCAGHMCVCLN
jgi:hypothetical protein